MMIIPQPWWFLIHLFALITASHWISNSGLIPATLSQSWILATGWNICVTRTFEFFVSFWHFKIRAQITHYLIHSSIDSDAISRSKIPLFWLSTYICAIIDNMKQCTLIEETFMSGVMLHQTWVIGQFIVSQTCRYRFFGFVLLICCCIHAALSYRRNFKTRLESYSIVRSSR